MMPGKVWLLDEVVELEVVGEVGWMGWMALVEDEPPTFPKTRTELESTVKIPAVVPTIDPAMMPGKVWLFDEVVELEVVGVVALAVLVVGELPTFPKI